MGMREKVVINNVEHEIEVQPCTLVFNSTHYDTFYERLMITPEMTLKHFEEIKELNIYEECFFRFIVTDYKEIFTKENLQKSGMGVKHLVGLVSMTLNCFLRGEKFGWKYPESFVHPKYQGNMADLLVLMNKRDEFIKFIENIKNGRLLNCENVHDKFFGIICCKKLKNFVQ